MKILFCLLIWNFYGVNQELWVYFHLSFFSFWAYCNRFFGLKQFSLSYLYVPNYYLSKTEAKSLVHVLYFGYLFLILRMLEQEKPTFKLWEWDRQTCKYLYNHFQVWIRETYWLYSFCKIWCYHEEFKSGLGHTLSY